MLIDKAWSRVKSKDASFGEKFAAWLVTNAMKAKVHLGQGMKRKRKERVRFYRAVVKPVLKELRLNSNADAYQIAKKNIRRIGRKNIVVPRVILLPKKGGFLVPLISGHAALGGLIGAGSSVISTVKKVQDAKEQLAEAQRHNAVMEAIAIGKKGSGLYIEPYRKGFGLFIRRNKKKNLKSLKCF